MATYDTFWEWIHAIQEYHPHTKTTVTILDNSILVDSLDKVEIAHWNNANNTGTVAIIDD